ncbi:MAG: DUF29 domain-containing protein [Symploca sp. SIO1B1]|nr:DUF29 domain-containing protein [Symploca sp. SIO1C2]NER97053.1 DUF29 domain-containing protein [Symploca sp. SIO1B1]
MKTSDPSVKNLYYSDFYSWLQRQAELLRKQQWEQLDIVNLIEEIETLGRQERRELVNRLGLLLGHLLKWQYQPELRGTSWQATIREQRRKIIRLLQQSPSLKPYLEEAIQEGYEDGLDLAVRETGIAYEVFPGNCNYTMEQLFDHEFFPEEEED